MYNWNRISRWKFVINHSTLKSIHNWPTQKYLKNLSLILTNAFKAKTPKKILLLDPILRWLLHFATLILQIGQIPGSSIFRCTYLCIKRTSLVTNWHIKPLPYAEYIREEGIFRKGKELKREISVISKKMIDESDYVA